MHWQLPTNKQQPEPTSDAVALIRAPALGDKQLRRKWASCSSRGTLTLSDDVLRLPKDLAEYVVCHELVHLRVPGHGKAWQAMMGAHLPDWRARERRLAGWVVRGGTL